MSTNIPTPFLVMRQGPQPNQVFDLQKATLTIGRTEDNDIVINDENVSRQHARLTWQGEAWIIEDLGSTNGTFVNGERISAPTILTPASQIALGQDVLLSMAVGGPPPGWVPSPERPAPVKAQERRTSRWPLLAGLSTLVILGIILIFAAAAVLAYFYFKPSIDLGGAPTQAVDLALLPGPEVIFERPQPGSEIQVGDSVLIFVSAYDESGVTRIDLWVDDLLALQQTSFDNNGNNPLSLIHEMVAANPGDHVLLARAYNKQGAMGESMLQTITVTEKRDETAPVVHIIDEGETLEILANKAGITVPTILGANPGPPSSFVPGRAVILPMPVHPPLPVPGAAQPGGQQKWQPGVFPGGQPAGQPGALPGGQPAGQPGAPPGGMGVLIPGAAAPANVNVASPTNLTASPGECSVKLTWQDASNNETAFWVYRYAIPGPFGGTLITKLSANATTYIDTVPQAAKYGYMVAAVLQTPTQTQTAPSNQTWVDVVASPLCKQAARFKQLIFRPLTFLPSGGQFAGGFLDVTALGNPTIRLPTAQQTQLNIGNLGAEWTRIIPAPASFYTSRFITLEVAGFGVDAKKIPIDLGQFRNSHTITDLSSGNRIFVGTAPQFKLTYNLLLRDWQWSGQGTNATIPIPYNVRLTDFSADKLSFNLAWDYDQQYKKDHLDGFILYQVFECLGENKQIRMPRALPKDPQKLSLNLGNEPPSCKCKYQVSAYGPAGESALSEPSKEECATQPHDNVLKITFMELSIAQAALPKATQGTINLFANDKIRESPQMLLEAKSYPLKDIVTGSTMALPIKSPSLQLGFLVTNVCKSVDETMPNALNGIYTISSPDRNCKLTVLVEGSRAAAQAAPAAPAAPAAKPTADWMVLKPGATCTDNGECTTQLCDDGKCASNPGQIGGSSLDYCHKNSHCYNQKCVCPNGWEGDKCKGWEYFTETYHGQCATGRANGQLCTTNSACFSGYCANGWCAPKDGTGQVGDYCHHNNHCANGYCFCPKGYNGDFCKPYSSGYPTPGRCIAWPGYKNGATCKIDDDCASRHCANGICAPRDFTGIENEYCHHNNHCLSRRCICPFGSADIWGFCPDWEKFTADVYGMCSAP